MNALLIIIALLEMITAMYAAVICVQGCCGGKAPKHTTLPVSSHYLPYPEIFSLSELKACKELYPPALNAGFTTELCCIPLVCQGRIFLSYSSQCETSEMRVSFQTLVKNR